MEAEKYTYLYPIYFDAEKTCFEGRRLPSSLCKKNPQANDILLAVQSCGMAAELEQDKSHPRSLVSSGRVKVFKSISISKNELMLKIASVLPLVSKTSFNNSNNNTGTSAKPTNSSSTSVEIAPNVVYQVRSKKNKKNK